MKQLPVILVTGFLGSGKTTLLRHLAESHPELSLLFLVNEFAATGLDARILEDTGLPTRSVVGGSLFCECKAGEFVNVMRETVMNIHRERQLEAVIIETSGIADPEAIGYLMKDHGLEHMYRIQRIITIVAPGNLHKLLGNLPVVRVQIETSDLVIINKVDLASDAEVARAQDTILQINPLAEMVSASFCEVEFSIQGPERPLPHGALSTCEANPFSTRELDMPPRVCMEQLKDAVAALPEEILRIKGFVRNASGWWSVERTVDSLRVEPMNRPGGQSRLILIAHDDHEHLLDKATTDLRNGLEPNA